MVSHFVQDLNQSRTAKHHCKHNHYSWIYFKKQWTQNSNDFLVTIKTQQLDYSQLLYSHKSHNHTHYNKYSIFFNNSNMALIVGRQFHTISLHIMCNPQIHWSKVIKINVAHGDKVFFCTASKKGFWGDFVPSSLFLLNSPSLKITQHWQKVEGWDIYLVL